MRKGGCAYGPTRPRGSAPNHASMEQASRRPLQCRAMRRPAGFRCGAECAGGWAVRSADIRPVQTHEGNADRPTLRACDRCARKCTAAAEPRALPCLSLVHVVCLGHSLVRCMRAGVVWCGTGLLSAGESVLRGQLAVLYDLHYGWRSPRPPSPIDPLRWITRPRIREPAHACVS